MNILRLFRTRSCGLVCALVLGSWSVRAWAVVAITADMNSKGLNPKAIGEDGTTSLYAHSSQSAPDAVGPNDTITLTQIINGQPVDPANAPQVTDSAFKIPVGQADNPNQLIYYGPTVALLKQKKSLLVTDGDDQILQSLSGDFKGGAYQASNDGKNTIYAFAKNRYLIRPADAPKTIGKAAGAAYDPFMVPGGQSYAYQPNIDISIGSDGDSSGSVLFYALDIHTYASSDLETFADAGMPMDQTLWNLRIGADGPITSQLQLHIQFQLNPAALSEIHFAPSMTVGFANFYSLPPAVQAVLISAEIDTNLSTPGRFTVSGGTATLTDYDLFAPGTTFTSSGGSVPFGEGVNVSGVEVPEPAVVALIVIAVVGSVAGRRRTS